jgi:hypothetical protein
MPLELGIAMVFCYMGRGKKKRPPHDWLLLVPSGHQYLKFVSDLGAFDPETHEGTVDTVVPKVVSWLAGRPGSIHTPTATAVLDALPPFEARKKDLDEAWKGAVPWREVLKAAEASVPKL